MELCAKDEFLMDAFSFLSVSDSACVICHLYRNAVRPPMPLVQQCCDGEHLFCLWAGGWGEAPSLRNDGMDMLGLDIDNR